MRWALPLVIFLFAAPVQADQTARPRQKCPPGTEAFGAPPPRGKQVWCRRPVPGGFERQGTYSAFHRNGERRVDGNYDRNRRHGKWTTYDRFGNKVKEEYYYDDKKYREMRFDKSGNAHVYDAKKERAKRRKAKNELTNWSGKKQKRQGN